MLCEHLSYVPFMLSGPQAFALLASPSSGIPPLDPVPGLKHVSKIADDVCYIIGDTSVGVSALLSVQFVGRAFLCA